MTQSPSLQTTLQDRVEAGQRLVEPLLKYAQRPDVIVLALPGAACRSPIKWSRPWTCAWT
jgi:predicted phosphoribosyltransferase